MTREEFRAGLMASRKWGVRRLVERQFADHDGDLFDEVVELHTGGRPYSDYSDDELLGVWDEMDEEYET